jgi:hypothetical protein
LPLGDANPPKKIRLLHDDANCQILVKVGMESLIHIRRTAISRILKQADKEAERSASHSTKTWLEQYGLSGDSKRLILRDGIRGKGDGMAPMKELSDYEDTRRQEKFAKTEMHNAESVVNEARRGNCDVAEAAQVLARAKEMYEAKDFQRAIELSLECRRIAYALMNKRGWTTERGESPLASNSMKSELEEDLMLIPGTYSVHVLIDRKKFREEDKACLIDAIRDVVYAMRVQNIGHYPLEFDAHNAHVSIRKHLASQGERIKVSFAP